MSFCVGNPFKGWQYAGEVILTAVRWYLRYPLAYERIRVVSGAGTCRGCQLRMALGRSVRSGIEQAVPPHLKPINKSYRVDETYIKVKGQEKYL